jgi:hypothetical protein
MIYVQIYMICCIITLFIGMTTLMYRYRYTQDKTGKANS